MEEKWDHSNFYIILSFAGLFSLLFFIFIAPAAPDTDKLILVLFILTCVLGGLAAIYPHQCTGILMAKKDALSGRNHKGLKDFKGHHPDCEEFQGHVLFIKGEKYCAGCTGLFMGALIAIAGSVIYYFYSFSFNGKLAVIIGLLAVFISLFILFLNKAYSRVKFTANFFLVLGSFLLLLGMYNLKTIMIIQFYFLGLILVWIVSRSEVSRKNHESICRKCKYEADCEL